MSESKREGRNIGLPAVVAGVMAVVAGAAGWQALRRAAGDRALLPRGKALITGASSGIGEEYARQLAAAGFDLILVARREERLLALTEELGTAHGIRAAVKAADLSTAEGIAQIVKVIEDTPDITLLINNAGFGTNGDFLEVDLARHLQMVQVHIVATVSLVRSALPAMVERADGAIINVSSIASFFPSGGGVMYSATKVFLNNFSEALAAELEGTRVRVQVLCPGFTYTGFHDTPEFADFDRKDVPERLWMSAEDVVKESLAALDGERVIVVPGRAYRSIVAAANSPLRGAFQSAGRRIKRAWRRGRSVDR